jgi:hypothetical protein
MAGEARAKNDRKDKSLPTKGFSMFVSLVWLERPSQLILDRLEN